MSTSNTFSEWLQTSHGQYLLAREQEFIDRSVADVFGFHAMQLGLPQHDLLRESRIPLRVIAGMEQGVQLELNVDELPFASDSLDLVLLPHVLEFNEHPHQILREVGRATLPGGHVIITGFNPRSLWGMQRLMVDKDVYPWRGRFISLPRLRDWLALLGFEIVEGYQACHAPPLISMGLMKRMHIISASHIPHWSMCGGIYMLKAVKTVPGMRLIKPKWNNGLVQKLLPVQAKLNNRMQQRSDEQ